MSDVRSWTASCAGAMPAFIAVPQGDTKTPAVVVMHERYGFVRHTRDLAERFARDGFVAIAPDFYFKHPDQEALHRGDVGCDMTDPEAILLSIDAVVPAAQEYGDGGPTRYIRSWRGRLIKC